MDPAGNYQLVMGNNHLLLRAFPELEPYIGRAVTVTGKVVVFNLFNGTSDTQLAPHIVTFGTP